MNIFDKALKYIKDKWELVKKSENAALKEQFPVITIPSNEPLPEEKKKATRKPRAKKSSNVVIESNNVDPMAKKPVRKSKTKTPDNLEN